MADTANDKTNIKAIKRSYSNEIKSEKNSFRKWRKKTTESDSCQAHIFLVCKTILQNANYKIEKKKLQNK